VGRFSGATLFDRIGLAVCEAGCLPRKELYEAWEVARRARRWFRGGRVIDPASDTVLGSIVLSGRNAFGDASRLAHEPGTGKLLVAEAGNVYRTGDGGIERIDPLAPFERAAEGFVITEEALGGSITDFVFVSPTKGYAVVTTESIKNVLVAFDPSRGVATRHVLVRDGFLPDVALAPDGMLWLADQGLPVPGIRIFDPRNDRQLTRAPLQVGLPPFSMGFLP